MRRKLKSARLTASELKRRIPDVAGVAKDLYQIEFKNGVARCPFSENHNHGDRDPSLRHDRKKRRLFCASQNCFGEQGADAIGLVQQMDRCRFPEAVQKLSNHYGLQTVGQNRDSPRPSPVIRSATLEGTNDNKHPVLADPARQKLQRQGYCVVAEYEYGADLRKVRFEHKSKL
jgi:DNA primase